MAAGVFAKIADTEQVWGRTRTVMATYTGDASYNAGGDPIPGNMGLRGVRGIDMLAQNTASIGKTVVWNSQTGKLQIISAGADFSGNASTFQFTIQVVSIDD